MPVFGQVFVKGRRPFWPKENFALMPDFGQVFVKSEGLFGCRGRFKLPLPMAGALKGPVFFCLPNIAAPELAAFGFGFFVAFFWGITSLYL